MYVSIGQCVNFAQISGQSRTTSLPREKDTNYLIADYLLRRILIMIFDKV